MKYFARIIMVLSILLGNISSLGAVFAEEVSAYQELNTKIVVDYNYYDIHTMPAQPTNTIDVTDHLWF